MVTLPNEDGPPATDPNRSNYIGVQEGGEDPWAANNAPGSAFEQQNANNQFGTAATPNINNHSPSGPNATPPPSGLYDRFEQIGETSWGPHDMVVPQMTAQSSQSSSGTRLVTNPFLRRNISQNGIDAGSVSSAPPTAPPFSSPPVSLNQMNPVNSSTNNLGSSLLEHQTSQSSSSQVLPCASPRQGDSSNRLGAHFLHPQESHPAQSVISLASATSSQTKDKQVNSAPSDDWDLLTNDVPSHYGPPESTTAQYGAVTNEKQAPLDIQPSLHTLSPPAARPSPSPRPRRMVDEAVGPVDASGPSGQAETLTYYIKMIRWEDERNSRPRLTPILVQNQNGPCPLLAIANTLTLTVPRNTQSDLIESLQAREQITLDTLVTNVVNELFAPYRVRDESAITDPIEYAEFLKSLSEGMNVNPRFFPTEDTISQYKRTSLTHIHPTLRNDVVPGSFEDSAEMRMFSNFAIPLIHGWIPARGSKECAALDRQAASYEDATILISRQDELESKLENGLNEEEMQMYMDSLIVKDFMFQDASTQLTEYGLDIIQKAMKPGAFAILFRNEHFSTLYRHPLTEQLFSLVTDAGMASHEEVVWESLADTTGMNTEHFSGDFRPVGGPESQIIEQVAPPSTTSGRRQRHNPHARGSSHSATDFGPVGTVPQRGSSASAGVTSPGNEQEDRDFAFALQLQEEEDHRVAAAEARRRRESHLSEQYIEQQGRSPPLQQQPQLQSPRARRSASGTNTTNIFCDTPQSSTQVPVIRNQTQVIQATQATQATQARTTSVGRSMLSPSGPTIRGQVISRPADAQEVGAPPTYEQAARQQAFTPPEGHPAHPLSTPGSETALAVPADAGVPVGGMGVRVNGNTGNGRRTMGSGIGRGYPGQQMVANPAPQQPQGRPAQSGPGKKGKGDCVVM